MKLRTRAYGEAAEDTIQHNRACRSTLYGVDSTPVDCIPAGRQHDVSVRPQWMLDQFMISSLEQHSSKELCESAASWGPDFTAPKGQFCDMKRKVLTPLCSAAMVEGGMAIDGTYLKKHSSVGKCETHIAKKAHEGVVHW
ncbi:hypothetical protein CERZMDRAFT_96042 [Cercospora zeae-maydis SCOH1-5]|uniref:Uncharacterized protein n=1 Tax=Cercospora zeae-maydis SCOH1-5 TaxID=717836 RepID=A0A6A6FKM7_9PEZI|nr:hypothetical protein CERZMDRAFT_96042 [Cercospora zeae-maydis SCOH1-5]